MNFKTFEGNSGDAWKYVFTKEDMVAEAVLYKYNSYYDRTVICCSVMEWLSCWMSLLRHWL